VALLLDFISVNKHGGLGSLRQRGCSARLPNSDDSHRSTGGWLESDAHADTDSYTNPNAYTDSNAYANPYTDSHADTYAHAKPVDNAARTSGGCPRSPGQEAVADFLGGTPKWWRGALVRVPSGSAIVDLYDANFCDH